MAGYPVIHDDGVDVYDEEGNVTHYDVGDTVPLSKLISRRFSWLVNRGYVSESEVGFGGATTDLTDVEYIGFNTSAPYHTAGVGDLTWNNDDGTLNLGLLGGNVTLQVGQEQVARIKNTTGSPLSNGQLVYITGSAGSGGNYRITVSLAKADSEVSSSKTLGVVTESIANGQEGFVTTFGLVRDIDTSAFNEGDALWLSESTAGAMTSTRPTAPNHAVFIGYVARKNASTGSVFVNVQNGYEINELHDVLITSVQNKDILRYNSTTGVWENVGLAAAIADIDGAGSGIDADKLDGQHGSYYAPVDNPTFTGVATFQGYIDLESAQLDSDLKSISVTTPFLLDAFSATLYRTAEYTVQLSQGTNFTVCKLLLIHNGTDVGITEYGFAEIGTTIPFTFSTNYSAGILELLITCSNANITTVGAKFSRLLYDA
jgi:hypothetical protein